MKINRICILLIVLLALSACGVGQFFIKRSVMALEKDIANEYKSFAKFTDTQETEIERVANLTAVWVRSNRLLVLQSELEKLASDIETNARLEEQNWRSFVIFLEDPFALDEAPEVLASMSRLAYEMTDEQSQSAIKKLTKYHRKESRALAKRTAEKQLDDLMSGIKTVFKELDIPRSKKQLLEAKNTLSQRIDYIDFHRKNSKQQFQIFSGLLSMIRGSETDFHERFIKAWEVTTASPRESMPTEWQHNYTVSYSAMNGLLSDLDQAQRLKAATKIREYAALFGELAVIDK